MKIVPNDIKESQRRSLDVDVTCAMKNVYIAKSLSHDRRLYTVQVRRTGRLRYQVKCSCPWQKAGNEGCVHALAAFRAYAEERGRYVSFWSSLEEAEAQKHRVLRIGDRLWVTLRNIPEEE